uniref:Ribosome biogenesis protein NSA1 n=1 Tax=Psilocybe cubensis TaxID=181762 RepID=A0A8H7Y5W5_PSICU
MSRFLLGDEIGNIKILCYNPESTEESKCTISKLYQPAVVAGPSIGVQKLATSSQGEGYAKSTVLAAAFSDGTCFASSLKDDDSLETLLEWKEPRIVANKFVGMSILDSSVYTCTSNGMLRRTPFSLDGEAIENSQPQTGILPSRLRDWRLSADGTTFAYGGDEVDLSVWNTELALSTQPVPAKPVDGTKKRKRNDDFFPSEIWRARNVPNDSLSLRQPIRITALTYLSSSTNGHHIVTGTQFGDVRRYDTRAARRPVSIWTGIAKVNGVKTLEKGFSENELFMSDNGSNLSSVDLRTGGILYTYKGISGAISSIAQTPDVVVSTSLDRYARVHSVVSPPPVARAHQEKKGQVLEKVYVTSIPTVVVWDKQISAKAEIEETNEDDDEVWDTMEHIS